LRHSPRLQGRLSASAGRFTLLIGACGALVLGAIPNAEAQTTSNTSLRGGTLASIASLPDWSGMWAPGRAPPGEPAELRSPGPMANGAPFKPEIAAQNAARMKRVTGNGAGGEADIPLSNSGFCIPGGVPGNMTLVSHEYGFAPGRVYIILENSETRRIYTDGRGHVPLEDATPSFQGDSIGHWEGDTLVVETNNIYPEAEFGFGVHVSDKTAIHERFTRVGDKLRVETEITDPTLFTAPWKFNRWFDREDREFVEYVPCTMADRAVKQGDLLKGIDFNPNRNALGAK
jgi:hypothetical protein